MGTNPDDGPVESGTDTATDGGEAVGFDEAALYSVVRRAVTDAILDAVGTLLLVGIGFVLVIAGARAAILAEAAPGVVIGAVLATIGFYIAAATLEVIPPIREWV